MPLRLLEAPTLEVVTLDEVKGHLRVDSDDDDDLIAGYIATAMQSLDAEKGALERCLAPQRWAMDLDGFPADPDRRQWRRHTREIQRELEIVWLPLPPVTSIDLVTYVDPDGATQTLAADVDYLAHLGEPAAIEPFPGTCWPCARHQLRAVTVEFTAGYPASADNAELAAAPEPIRHAIKLIVSDLYENRESTTLEDTRAVLIQNPTLQRLLKPFQTR